MQTLLFDDKGELWDAKSRTLADTLQTSLSCEDLLKYVVKNLGFIAATDGEGSLRLRLRPAVVSQTALSALLYWLHDRVVDRVLISCLDREWSHELVRSREEAMSRLLSCVKFSPADREGDFLNVPRPLQDLALASPLRAVLNAWEECGGKFDFERMQPVIQNALNGRFVLFEAPSNSSIVHVKDVGGGLGKSAGYWLSRTKGLRVEDQPDYAYGLWVAGACRQVVATREPSFEDIDAVITWPQQPRIGYRYRRLMVPFEGEGSSTLVLSATVIDPEINLRRKPG